MQSVAVLMAVLTCCTWSSQAIRLNKTSGGYEDIVVAIHPSVKPDERIIDNIKALFTSASSFLHRATGGRVHFSSVTIAVPDTWSVRPRAAVTAANMFPGADVRVATENPQYRDTPYTLQPRGCGERGEYIHLTPRFLANMNGSMSEIYVNPAYQLVHEWAHYRYGVFDEYGDPESFRYPVMYCEFGMVRASTCSDRIKFRAYTDSGEPCRIYKGCRVSSKCKARFIADTKDPVTSSIMFMPYLEGVSEFCDDAEKEHNAFAPNKHNHLCNRRSTWKVISGNEDFQNLPPSDTKKSITVNFREVQKREGTLGRVILALDVSGSMSANDRINQLRVAATHFVQVLIPDGLEVGLVSFSYNARKLAELKYVEKSTRDFLVRTIGTLSADSSTCIGCALEMALQMFLEGGQRTEGSVIILMTDGEENQTPYIADVKDKLVAAGIVVNTIAFGTEAEDKLERLALSTGGKPFALRDDQRNVAAALESAFLDSTVSLLDDANKPVVIFEKPAKIVAKQDFEIVIDGGLGNGTTIMVLGREASKLQVELLYPDGKACQQCLQAGPSTTDSYITLKVPGIATPGTWKLVLSHNITGGVSVDVHVRATSLASDPSEEPVLVRAFLKRTEVVHAEEAAIYAEVSKGPHAVLHARVTATVIRPRPPHEVEVELFDDGIGADVTANDGIYSSYFTQFEGAGRYSVTAHVVSSNRSVIIKGRKASGGLPAVPPGVDGTGSTTLAPPTEHINGIPLNQFVYVDEDISVAEPIVLDSEKAPQFSRIAEGGSFRLGNEITESSIPPGSIQDLGVEDAFVDDDGKHVVLLTWSCPGAHMNSGNASRISLRASTSLENLVKNFTSGLEISADGHNDTSIQAGPVGSRQQVRITLPHDLLSYAQNNSRLDFYFAAKVVNERGLESSASNVARATFERPPEFSPSSTTKGTPVWVVVVSVLAALAVLAVLVAAGVWATRRHRKQSANLPPPRKPVSSL